MKKSNSKTYFFKCFLVPLLFMGFGTISAQQLYVGDGGIWYLEAGANFTTSNTVVAEHANGTFAVQGGTNWATAAEFVDGKVTVIGAGSTTANVGDGIQSTIALVATANDEIVCDYTRSAPSGTMDASLTSYALSDAEYWSVVSNTGQSQYPTVSGLTNTATTYGGEAPLGSPVVVRRDNAGSNWVLYSSNPGFGEFAYAAEVATLGVGDFNANTFSFYPNPVDASAQSINFNLPSNVQQLTVTMYDVTGKILKRYQDLPLQTGVNSISKPQVATGLYLLNFSFNNGAQQVTKRVIIE